MRQIGDNRYTQVEVIDEPNEKSKACYSYAIVPAKTTGAVPFAHVHFQDGPIKEAGINGCHNEDLLTIVIDRLQGFQSSEYKCRENAIALTKIEEALLWLNKRSRNREARGVEGTHTV